MKQLITREKFLDYETVRKSGFYNILDPQARALTNLSATEWLAIIEDYSELKNKYIGDSNEQ